MLIQVRDDTKENRAHADGCTRCENNANRLNGAHVLGKRLNISLEFVANVICYDWYLFKGIHSAEKPASLDQTMLQQLCDTSLGLSHL
jgi:hypothetical protein